MEKQQELILKAYSLLCDVTPLKYDCGALCDSLCCKNNGKDGETLGMWLLPYERETLKDCKYYTFGKADDGTETVFCSGRCDRKMRPFACRIYPYYAHLSKLENGRIKISVKIDPRARLSCPIAARESYLRPSIRFLAYVKMAIRTLLKDKEISRELFEISDFLSEIEEMQRKFFD